MSARIGKDATPREIIGWLAMGLTLGGVAIQSLLPTLMRYSFVLLLASSLLWLLDSLRRANRPLVCLQATLVLLNLISISRYFFFGRLW